MVWLSNVMIGWKTYSNGLPFAHLKKEKMIFLKTDKNTTLQRKVSTQQNSAHFKNFSWICSFWNHHVDLIKGLCHHLGWPLVSSKISWTTSWPDHPKRGTYAVYQRLDLNHLSDLWIGLNLELRLDLILPKEVHKQSSKDSVPIICRTFG